MGKQKSGKTVLLAVKIALGSSFVIYLAQIMELEYATSAGTITLLTLMTTKWETIRLSVLRIVTFIIVILLAGLVFFHINSVWIGYGIFIFGIVWCAETLGLRATISVNSVIGTHLLTNRNFSIASVKNEFFLILIGIVVALVLNLFYNNQGHKKDIVFYMRYTEHQLQMILGELAAYLSNKEMQRNVWDDIIKLEKELQEFIGEAYEYQGNTFHSHPAYYIDYFEMRTNQCHVLHNLHYELKKLRALPRQARIVAEYILYLAEYVVEKNIPSAQIEELENIFGEMKKEELPKTREEFENRAILYHILMDIEEFLIYKQRFVEALDEKQKKMYWMQ